MFIFTCKKCGRQLHCDHHGCPSYCHPSCEEVDKVVGKGKPVVVHGVVKHKQFGYVEEF